MKVIEKKEEKVPISSIAPGKCFRTDCDEIYMVVNASNYNISFKNKRLFNEDYSIVVVKIENGELTRMRNGSEVIPINVTATIGE